MPPLMSLGLVNLTVLNPRLNPHLEIEGKPVSGLVSDNNMSQYMAFILFKYMVLLVKVFPAHS